MARQYKAGDKVTIELTVAAVIDGKPTNEQRVYFLEPGFGCVAVSLLDPAVKEHVNVNQPRPNPSPSPD